MKGDYFMRQCLVEWEHDGLRRFLETCWLPEELAHVGKTIVLNARGTQAGDYDRRGMVIEAHAGRLLYSYVNERSRDYKHTREASDV